MAVDRGKPSDALNQIGNVDWPDMTARLLVFAKRQVAARTWNGVRRGEMPNGFCAEDFVQEAVRKAFDGSRKWDPKAVDLFGFLCGVIRSEINHLSMRRENRNVRFGGLDADIDQALLSRNAAGLSVVPQTENEIYIREIQELLLNHFKKETMICEIILIMMKEYISEPKSIAKRLGMKVEYVNDAKKRIKRKVTRLRDSEGGDCEDG